MSRNVGSFMTKKSLLLCQDPENLRFLTICIVNKNTANIYKEKRNLSLLPTTYCLLLQRRTIIFDLFLFPQIYCLSKIQFSLPHDTILTWLPLTSRFITMEKIFYSSSSHSNSKKFAWSIIECGSGRKLEITNWK